MNRHLRQDRIGISIVLRETVHLLSLHYYRHLADTQIIYLLCDLSPRVPQSKIDGPMFHRYVHRYSPCSTLLWDLST